MAPSIFAEKPSSEVSKHYTHIPTTKVIDDMELLGWKPTMVIEDWIKKYKKDIGLV